MIFALNLCKPLLKTSCFMQELKFCIGLGQLMSIGILQVPQGNDCDNTLLWWCEHWGEWLEARV